jgi:hypothetical protein
MVKVTRRDFLKMAGAAGAGAAALGAGIFGWKSTIGSDEKSETKMSKSTPYTWVRFLAGTDETILRPLTTDLEGKIEHYTVREVVPVIGEAPTNLMQSKNVLRIETSIPFSEETLSHDDSSVIQFHGIRQHLHYTSEAQRQELSKNARPEVEPSDHTTAVLIPIGKSEDWWKLSQDQRQAYFQKSDTRPGHTAIGLKYVDRVFRKLYHSRYLNAALGYDFLTYFEFEDVYANDFKALLAELRDTNINPEWAYVNREFEIWMTKVA